jgi:hypothetical protein
MYSGGPPCRPDVLCICLFSVPGTVNFELFAGGKHNGARAVGPGANGVEASLRLLLQPLRLLHPPPRHHHQLLPHPSPDDQVGVLIKGTVS